jgi:CheY-like chemotaxis protein
MCTTPCIISISRRKLTNGIADKCEHTLQMNRSSQTTVVILEDDPDRIREMSACLHGRFSEYEVVVFDNAPDMIERLSQHLEEVRLICLDHDLGPNRLRAGRVFDPGTGRDVADYLATRQPVCPIVIHTTNNLAAPGMEMVLEDTGWVHSRIVPYNDLEWVREGWIVKVAEALGIG